MYKSPKATVGAVLYHSKAGRGNILLTKRNIEPFYDFWCFPGGHVEKYETLENAVKREIFEETGLSFKPGFMYYFEEIFPEKSIHNVAIFYCGEATGKIVIDQKEVSEIKWFTIEEAINLKLAFSHNKVLEYYCNKFYKGL